MRGGSGLWKRGKGRSEIRLDNRTEVLLAGERVDGVVKHMDQIRDWRVVRAGYI